jgi:hypothetical protein
VTRTHRRTPEVAPTSRPNTDKGGEVNEMTTIRRRAPVLAATIGPLLYLAVETAGGWKP